MTHENIRRLFERLGVGVAGLVVFSLTASAHEFGHGTGNGDATAAFAVVLALPILAGLAGGIVAVRYRRLRGAEETERPSSLVIGILLVGLGVVSLLTAVTGHLWLSVIGGTIGAAVALRIVGSEAVPEAGCGTHAELTVGAISTHRALEGVILGALYSTGAAVGLFAAVVLAGHAALETAAVSGLYATVPRRTRAVGAILLVQVGYVAGGIAGLGVAETVPASVRALVLAIVGGSLLVIGTNETERSISGDESVLIG